MPFVRISDKIVTIIVRCNNSVVYYSNLVLLHSVCNAYSFSKIYKKNREEQ